MAQFTDCLIIGAGQAGLAMSQCLASAGIDHVVLERGTVGNRWVSQRWKSLRLLTPGWMARLPGRSLFGQDSSFRLASELPERLAAYRRDFALPVIEGVDVLALEPLGDRFRAVTSRGTWVARSVVVATGACDRPHVPGWARDLSPAIHQLASTEYQSADELPDGGVLVVGASATGVQLASELARSGRKVMISAGSHVRTPRSYRGRDLFDWFSASGYLGEAPPQGRSPAQMIAQPSLQLVGTPDRENIDLYRLAGEGVIVTGRATAADGPVVSFANDLVSQLERAEARRKRVLGRIDDYIERNLPGLSEDEGAWRNPPMLLPASGAIKLPSFGINTVLWATGYRRDYTWLHLDACDGSGELRQQGGICDVPGLFVLGLPHMRHRASSFIDGVGRDAEALAPAIAAHLGESSLIAA
ncbi:flavin-containing monooxygenase [Altererythrobacter sp.]|uniref:flavin-containing monooxygenase n=1 Tax=Altererythrobacter sp. TaxID=1872480 RepID=UPI003D050D2B